MEERRGREKEREGKCEKKTVRDGGRRVEVERERSAEKEREINRGGERRTGRGKRQ